jgi:hypothetical protein
MTKKIVIRMLLTSIIWGGGISGANAQESSEAYQLVDTYMRQISTLNTPTVTRGAGCLGSYGWHLGIGVQQVVLAELPTLTSENLNLEPAPEQKKTAMTYPTLTLAKGTPIPVDFVIKLASINSYVHQLGGVIQASLIEGLGIPAFAIRAGHSEIMGLPATSMKTDSFSAALSYSFWQYFTLFSEAVYYKHQSVLQKAGARPATFTALTNIEIDEDDTTKQSWSEAGYSYGMEFVVPRLPFSIALQSEQSSRRVLLQQFKITMFL